MTYTQEYVLESALNAAKARADILAAALRNLILEGDATADTKTTALAALEAAAGIGFGAEPEQFPGLTAG